MNMFCWNVTSGRFQMFINESYFKKLEYTKQYEHVLLEHYEHLSVKGTFRHYVMRTLWTCFHWNTMSIMCQTFNQSKLPYHTLMCMV